MKKILFLLFTCSAFITSHCQIEPISVAELTIKISGMSNEELFYGFAKGDHIIFNFEELNGKKLNEIEINELPNNSKYIAYKATKIEDKKLLANQKSVYQFKFKNTAISGRICKVKIQRIPSTSNLISFNTNWEWKTKYDTTFEHYTQDSLIGYDTTYIEKSKKVLIKVDTISNEIFNKNERVHSITAIGEKPSTTLNFNLPKNTYSPNIFNPYQSTEVLAWSYWIGVGQKSKEEYEKANSKIINGISTLGNYMPYGALYSLAIKGISIFAVPNVGENVVYQFSTTQFGVNKVFDSGDGISASGRNTNILQGNINIYLYNNNYKDGIDVTVKVLCVQVNKIWKDQKYSEQVLEPKYLTLDKKKIKVKASRIRVNSD